MNINEISIDGTELFCGNLFLKCMQLKIMQLPVLCVLCHVRVMINEMII